MDHRKQRILAIIVGGLVIRLALAPWVVYGYDLGLYIKWGLAMVEHGWLNVYSASTANYPPLAVAVMNITAWLAHLLTPSTVNPDAGNYLWRIVMKLPAILADTGIALTVWRMSWNQRGSEWVVGAVAFNPAMIYLSAMWGQIDSEYALMVLVALWMALSERPFLAGIAFAAAALFKEQGLVATPIVGLAILSNAVDRLQARRDESWTFRAVLEALRPIDLAAAGYFLTLGLFVIPFIAAGQFSRMVTNMLEYPASGSLTINALNTWYLVTDGVGNVGGPIHASDPGIGGLTLGQIGRLVLLVWLIIVLILVWHSRRDRAAWYIGGAMIYLGTFLFLTDMRERYSFAVLVMLAGAAAVSLAQGSNRKQAALFALFGIFTLSHLVNLMFVWGPTPTLEHLFVDNQQVGMVVAFAMVLSGLVGIWLLIYRATLKAPSPQV